MKKEIVRNSLVFESKFDQQRSMHWHSVERVPIVVYRDYSGRKWVMVVSYL